MEKPYLPTDSIIRAAAETNTEIFHVLCHKPKTCGVRLQLQEPGRGRRRRKDRPGTQHPGQIRQESQNVCD